ncbi:MAG: D-amino-acid transaminase [Alphaproteobacteria bacterium]
MSRLAYVNGRYVPHAQAMVHVEDRGFQFSDGIYEVCALSGGLFLDFEGHMTRLERSLREMSMAAPMPIRALSVVMGEVVRRNRVRDGIVYIQITRGVARRDHPFPTKPVRPSLIVTARSIRPERQEDAALKGVSVVTTEDLRWGRCDIKSVSLLANVLAIQGAREQGADDAWLFDGDGNVTESSRSSAWIVTQDGTLVTRYLDRHILPGITRQTLYDVAVRQGYRVEERAFSVEEAKAAREAFMTSASAMVVPVVRIDEAVLGNGRPGSVSLTLRRLYQQAVGAQMPADGGGTGGSD